MTYTVGFEELDNVYDDFKVLDGTFSNDEEYDFLKCQFAFAKSCHQKKIIKECKQNMCNYITETIFKNYSNPFNLPL